jgi:ribonuclease HI
MPYYSVAVGRKKGIYMKWSDCRDQIQRFKGAKYKKFDTKEEAEEFMKENENYNQPLDELKADLFVYTDGSCINNGRKNAMGGIGIYFGENDSRNVSRKLEVEKPTNNIAELTAIYETYKIIENDIKEGKHIMIITDSSYSITCLTSYGKKNEKDNWSNDIKNKELVRKTYELYKDVANVRFKHINSHTDNKDIHSMGNDGADKLASDSLGLVKRSNLTDNRIYLNVPFSMKDQAKKKGAKWDCKKKSWFVYSDYKLKEELLEMFS